MHFVLFALSMLALSYESDSSISLNNYLDRYFQDEKTNYETHIADLNQDGLNDAIVYMTDRNWCDSGGCTLFIFQNTGIDYKMVSKVTVSTPQIKVSEQAHQGWNNIIVHSQGTGNVMLQYDGTSYPSNPSLLPLANADEVATATAIFNVN